MNELTRRIRPAVLVGIVSLAAVVSGCATVKPEELDGRLEALRAEMRNEMQ
jgi:hypothetical protein